jgi:hypothetical protein
MAATIPARNQDRETFNQRVAIAPGSGDLALLPGQ